MGWVNSDRRKRVISTSALTTQAGHADVQPGELLLDGVHDTLLFRQWS